MNSRFPVIRIKVLQITGYPVLSDSIFHGDSDFVFGFQIECPVHQIITGCFGRVFELPAIKLSLNQFSMESPILHPVLKLIIRLTG